jgi:hypothetical protein
VGQLPQTSYQSLHTPYSFFGLGRTNNYIENLFVGSTKHDTVHFINMEGVIPNSKVVINPPTGDHTDWKKELFLRPGEWIPWVTLTVVITTIILGIVVFVLHWNEKVRASVLTRIPVQLLISFYRGRTKSRDEEHYTILTSMHCNDFIYTHISASPTVYRRPYSSCISSQPPVPFDLLTRPSTRSFSR